MAKPSKQRPFAVEMQPPNTDGWYGIGAYKSQEEAEFQAAMARKGAPEAAVRVRVLENAS